MNPHTHVPSSAPARRTSASRAAVVAALLCCYGGPASAAVHDAARSPGTATRPSSAGIVRAAPDAPAVTAAGIADALARAMPRMRGWRGGPLLHDPDAVRAFYESRAQRPAWTTIAAVRTLRAGIAGAGADGLDVADLAGPAGTVNPFDASAEATSAERELLLTDLLLTLRARLRHGTTSPGAVSAPDVEPGEAFATDRDAARLSTLLDAGDVARAISEARPPTPLYAGLRTALARHLEAKASGGLPPAVGDGPTIEPGSTGERVARLRARLSAFDALDGLHGPRGDEYRPRDRSPDRASIDPTVFDPALGARVRGFQERQDLEADGKVGRLTLAAVDARLEDRIERLRLNLERARHIALALAEDDRIVVNVADQRLTLELDGETTWESDVVVGRTRHRTPVHIDRIRYMELDPTWNVPRRIVLDTLYERARKDPAAFANDGFVLRDIGGTWHDPREIDWATMTPERFHYDVVQRPGPRNPLGRVKFMFPNRYAVYLHDTPDRSLFDEDVRTFSRGCVRVEDADTLATLLLEHRNGVRRPDIVTLRAAADQVRIDLERPLLVALLYWTAEVDEDGTLRLIDDAYGRDAAAARELAASARS